jgi:hypothetical protein
MGCTSIEVGDYQPKKLTNIPNGAFWKGGIDGGNWFLIERINTHKIWLTFPFITTRMEV